MPSSTADDSDSLATLRRKAQDKLKQQMDRLDELSRKDIEELVHELGTLQIELEMQNEEMLRARAELEKSRRRYVDLYDFSPTGYFTVNTQGAIGSANLTAAAMLATDRNKLIGQPFILFVRKEDRDIFYLHLRKLKRDGDCHACELRLMKKNGSFFQARLESAVSRDENSDRIEIRTALSDISERRQAEDTLARERSLLDGIMDATDVMLASLDLDFNFVRVNPAFAAGCRMQPQELIGKNHFALFPHPENETIFRRVRDTGEPVFYKDKPFEFPDQPERGVTYWDWSLVPVKDESGVVTGLVFSLRETTKYKQAELALAASETRFRRMAEISADIIFQIDPAGGILYVSPAVRSLGYTPEQVMGEPFAKFIPPDELPKAMAALHRMQNGESISLFEISVLKGDGTIADCEVNATPIVRNKIVVGMQGMVRDISEHRRMEAALEQRSAELTELNRELEAFSYTVSHDLRTPLRSIEGFTTAIIEDYGAGLERGAKEHLDKVIAASQRMGQLIDAMLDMARLTGSELREAVVDLSSMAEVAVYELGKTSPERKVECTITKGMKVRGDFNLLRIVVENLLNNAWKFTTGTDKALIDFGVMQMGDLETGRQTAYFVRDNGAGFDPDYADKLFSPFARLHSEAEFPGLGIGLATVKKIIARHGGKIWAEGKPGKGATFYFTIPEP